MQLRSVDILDATRRVINILTNRPRMWLALDHPVILGGRAADAHRPVQCALRHDLGHHHRRGQRPEPCRHHCPGNEHPGHRAGGPDFLDDCDGRTVILDANQGPVHRLDPDAVPASRPRASICELQRENEEMGQLHSLPNRTNGTASL